MGEVSYRKSRVLFLSMFCAAFLVASALVLPATDVAAEDDGATLRIAIQQDVLDLNIFNLGSNSMWKTKVLSWGFEGIAGVDETGLPYPLLAESWTFDTSTLTIDIVLRDDVVFHDGQLLTADDVVFTYTALRSGTTCSSEIVAAFDQDGDFVLTQKEISSSVWATGDHSVGMKLSNPYGQFFSRTLTVPIIPEHVWEAHVDSEYRIDVTWGTDPAATIGTGPFAYAGGVEWEYRDMMKHDQYWGKEFVTPSGYNTYPPNVDQLHFEVIGDVESAVAAILSDEVDHIAWPVTANQLPDLEGDETVGIEFMADSGYFYLGFNEKLEPFGSLEFRKAVAHLVDKDTIVNDYLEGLGVQGTTCMPPTFGDWHNEAVIGYEYDGTMAESVALLEEGGFVDDNRDGWRDLPDGTPMEQIVILGPPADYDPVRTQTIMMVAENMRAAGIDAVAMPVDFDTLIASLDAMEYQMIILGWHFPVSYDPVGVAFDVLGPLSPSNLLGFWSDDNPNPYYSDLLGVNTLADAETQALADQVLDLEILARSTFDPYEQMQYTREAQATINDAVPVDVLYYRVNPEAYRAEWTGWMPFMGELLNMFSLSELELAGPEPIEGSVVVEKLQGTPADSASTYELEPSFDGTWTATVYNAGLKGLVIEVYDTSSGEAVLVSTSKLLLGSIPAGTVETDPVSLVAGGVYEFVLTPLGSAGGSATVVWTCSPQ